MRRTWATRREFGPRPAHPSRRRGILRAVPRPVRDHEPRTRALGAAFSPGPSLPGAAERCPLDRPGGGGAARPPARRADRRPGSDSPSSPAPRPPLPRPDDSARMRLDRVLAEIGIRSQKAKPAPPAAPPSRNLRDRVLETLADRSLTATFEEGADAPADVAETAGATEPLILEAVRQMREAGAVRAALGDLDRRLVATAALAEERTLTLTEGYLLSRIDGAASARQVLQLVPLDPDETERTLLGLVLTGRVEYRPAAVPHLVPRPEAEPPEPIAEPAEPIAEPAEPIAEPAEPVAEPAQAVAEPATGRRPAAGGDGGRPRHAARAVPAGPLRRSRTTAAARHGATRRCGARPRDRRAPEGDPRSLPVPAAEEPLRGPRRGTRLQ